MSAWLSPLLLAVALAGPQDALKEAADRYARGDAAGAAQAYETAIAAGADSADVFFNLGTCALRAGDLGRAVWALQEARRRDPWDEDVRFNLELAVKENPDTLVGAAEPPWLSAASVVPRAALQWLTLLVFLLLCGLLTARGVMGRSSALERASVRVGLVLLLLGSLLLFVESTAGAPLAVVLPKEASVRSAERVDAPEAFRVHAGLTVRPVGKPKNGMVRIRLANGLDGWVEQDAVRRVAD